MKITGKKKLKRRSILRSSRVSSGADFTPRYWQEMAAKETR